MIGVGKLMAGLAVVAAFGLAEAICSGRFNTNAPAQLDRLPLTLDDWQGQEIETPERTRRLSEADEIITRRYVHASTGQIVDVTLLVGRSGPLAVHTPEVCYGNVGLQLTAPPERATYPLNDGGMATLWSARLERRPLADLRLRSVWGWAAGGQWLAPDNPRFALAGQPRAGKLLIAWPADEPEPTGLIEVLLAEVSPMFGVSTGERH